MLLYVDIIYRCYSLQCSIKIYHSFLFLITRKYWKHKWKKRYIQNPVKHLNKYFQTFGYKLLTVCKKLHLKLCSVSSPGKSTFLVNLQALLNMNFTTFCLIHKLCCDKYISVIIDDFWVSYATDEISVRGCKTLDWTPTTPWQSMKIQKISFLVCGLFCILIPLSFPHLQAADKYKWLRSWGFIEVWQEFHSPARWHH